MVGLYTHKRARGAQSVMLGGYSALYCQENWEFLQDIVIFREHGTWRQQLILLVEHFSGLRHSLTTSKIEYVISTVPVGERWSIHRYIYMSVGMQKG
jgi:hypothetical protein